MFNRKVYARVLNGVLCLGLVVIPTLAAHATGGVTLPDSGVDIGGTATALSTVLFTAVVTCFTIGVAFMGVAKGWLLIRKYTRV